MTEQEQRIAIAEACGWERYYPADPTPEDESGWLQHGKTFSRKLPDYLHDLNAMHEAEQVLVNQGKENQYLSELADCCRPDGAEPDSIDDLLTAVRAKAPQRAEAFLRTIRKWKE